MTAEKRSRTLRRNERRGNHLIAVHLRMRKQMRMGVFCPPALKMSQMIAGASSNPPARTHAKQLRFDLHAVWFAVYGAASSEESQWRVSIEKGDLTREAFREDGKMP